MADFPFEGSLMQHHPASFLTPLSACLLALCPLGVGRQGFKGISCLPDSQQKGKGIKVPWTRLLFPNNSPSAPWVGGQGVHPSRAAATLQAPMALGRVPRDEGEPAPKAVVNGDGGELKSPWGLDVFSGRSTRLCSMSAVQ